MVRICNPPNQFGAWIVFSSLALCLAFCLGAEAQLSITITEAGDGGVDLVASGTSTGSAGAGIDNRVDLPFDSDMIFGPGTGAAFSDAESGTITVGANTFNVTSVWLSRTGSNDTVAFITNADVGFDVVTANSITASWAVATLPFSDLTPGVYTGLVDGTILQVIPEPATCTLVMFGGLVLAALRRQNRLSRC